MEKGKKDKLKCGGGGGVKEGLVWGRVRKTN